MRQLEIEEIDGVSGGNVWISALNRAISLGQAVGAVFTAASPGSLDVAADWEWHNLTA